MTTFTNKLVAIVNKDIEPGIAMNALAHASIAMGAKIGLEGLHLKFMQFCSLERRLVI